MNQTAMSDQLPALRILTYAWWGVGGLIGLAALLAAGASVYMMLTPTGTQADIAAYLVLFAAMVLGVFAAPSLFVAWSVGRRRNRVFALVIAALVSPLVMAPSVAALPLALVFVPLGLALGILTFVVLLKREVRDRFPA